MIAEKWYYFPDNKTLYRVESTSISIMGTELDLNIWMKKWLYIEENLNKVDIKDTPKLYELYGRKLELIEYMKKTISKLAKGCTSPNIQCYDIPATSIKISSSTRNRVKLMTGHHLPDDLCFSLGEVFPRFYDERRLIGFFKTNILLSMFITTSSYIEPWIIEKPLKTDIIKL
jgi:hypothetical protein